jgi:hypothetical protein
MKAYPIMYKHPTTGLIVEHEGMELRDWFAGLAMQGVMRDLDEDFEPSEFDDLAEFFYTMADAMMKFREKKDV